ncbi:MAG: hypothetical protein JWN46_87 [Acidimicrobiales bacterium]|nr:hypothetical protein [Acidimicrobiales bacterium]
MNGMATALTLDEAADFVRRWLADWILSGRDEEAAERAWAGTGPGLQATMVAAYVSTEPPQLGTSWSDAENGAAVCDYCSTWAAARRPSKPEWGFVNIEGGHVHAAVLTLDSTGLRYCVTRDAEGNNIVEVVGELTP